MFNRINCRRRRALKKDAPYLWSVAIRRSILTYWDNSCAYCSKPHEHFDHYIPISAVGTIGTVPWNMIPSCADCNLSKSNKDPNDWVTDISIKLKIEKAITHFKERYEDNDNNK